MLGHQGRRRFLPALFALFGAAPAALAAAAGFRNESDIPVLPAFLACAALGGVLSLIGRRHDTQSESETCTRRLSEAWDRLIRADCERLAQAVTDLAYGNLTSKLEIQSEPIRPADYAGAAELPGLFNELLARLNRCAAGFNTLTQTPSDRLCYVGADSYLEGHTCGEALGRLIGRGHVAILTTLGAISLELRSKGFQSVLAKKYPRIEVAAILNLAPMEGVKDQLAQFLNATPDLNGLYVTRGGYAPVVGHALEALGKQRQVRVVCHDFIEETLVCIHKGLISAALGQDPFAQGYDPVVYLYNHLVANQEPPSPRMLTRTDLVTAENVAQYWSPDKGRTPLQVEEHHAKPVRQSAPRPLRIVFISRSDNRFFDDVRAGVDAAARLLSTRNVSVQWMVPEKNRLSGDASAAVYAPVLAQCVESRVDGIVIGVFDPDLIPAINQTARCGIPIITFNSEPCGLRSMVQMSRQQAERLFHLSRDMTSTLEQVSGATAQIDSAIAQVSEGTLTLNSQFIDTRESLNSLLAHIDNLTRQSHDGMAVAKEVVAGSEKGSAAVTKNIRSLQDISASVSKIATTVEHLGKNSDRINLIIKMVSTIAYQIKLLGMNAAIEAAQAGKYGAGFSIVAGEIRSLAERTAQATREITEVISAIKAQIGEVQVLTKEGTERMKAGSDIAEETRAVLEQIRAGVEGNESRFEAVSLAIGELQAFSRQVGCVVENIATVSEKNASTSEEVSASTREMLAQLEEVGRMAQTVEAVSQGEQQLLAKFNLSDKDA